MTKLKIDLNRVIQLALPQVYGSDERAALNQFIARSRDPQLVDIDLAQILVLDQPKDPKAQILIDKINTGEICPICGSDNIKDIMDYRADKDSPDRFECLDCDFTWESSTKKTTGCGYCGNPNPETTADYIWCPVCSSGTFFAACPICDGNLAASLDPLAICQHCGHQWGQPIAKTFTNYHQPITADQLPAPMLKNLDQLRNWLSLLTIQEGDDPS